MARDHPSSGAAAIKSLRDGTFVTLHSQARSWRRIAGPQAGQRRGAAVLAVLARRQDPSRAHRHLRPVGAAEEAAADEEGLWDRGGARDVQGIGGPSHAAFRHRRAARSEGGEAQVVSREEGDRDRAVDAHLAEAPRRLRGALEGAGTPQPCRCPPDLQEACDGGLARLGERACTRPDPRPGARHASTIDRGLARDGPPTS